MQQLYEEEITLCLQQICSKRTHQAFFQKYIDQNSFVNYVQEVNKQIPLVEIQNFYTTILKQFNLKTMTLDLIIHLTNQISSDYSYDQSDIIMKTPEEICYLIQQSIASNNQRIEKIFEIFDADKDERLNEQEFKNLILYYVPIIFPEEYQELKKFYPSEKVTLEQLKTWISEIQVKRNNVKPKKPNLIEVDFKKMYQQSQQSMEFNSRNSNVIKCLRELQSRTTQYTSIRESNMYEDPRFANILSSNVAFQTHIKPNLSLIGAQDFQEVYDDIIQNQYEYIDKNFPASNQSLGSKLQEYEWERLSRIWPNYQIFVKDSEQQRNGLGKWISPMDIRQGELGDCYFLSTLSSIACRWPDTILELFLTQQKNPYGIIAVKLCIDGIWKAINLDDFIPVKNGNPAFSQSQCEEAWVILMEKAWAKSFGSYSNIISGESREVMRALTGGPTWSLRMEQKDFKKQFSDCIDRKCIMTTGTFADGKNYEAMGLIFEHSYSILKIRNVKHPEKGEVTLIKLQNPWGMKEWNGEWSDGHELWTQKIKARLRIKDKEEGEDENEDGIFYMSYKDFVSYFSTVSVGYFKTNYIYVSRSIISNARQSLHFTIEIPEKGEYYISVIQQSARHFKDKQPDYQYSLIRILFGYLTEEGYEFKEGKQEFDQEVFVGGILEKGQYIMEVKVQWKYYDEQNFNISSYGYKQITIKQIEKSKGIIKQMMIKLARQNQMLAPIKENFPMILTCAEKVCDSGIGYDYYKNNSDKILELDCQYSAMVGMKMKKPERGNQYRIVLKPGGETIVLFSIDRYYFNGKNSKRFNLK